MSVDKLVDSTQLDSDLTSVANAIRTKGGTSAPLAFPTGFVSAIGNIPTGGGKGVTEAMIVNMRDWFWANGNGFLSSKCNSDDNAESFFLVVSGNKDDTVLTVSPGSPLAISDLYTDARASVIEYNDGSVDLCSVYVDNGDLTVYPPLKANVTDGKIYSVSVSIHLTKAGYKYYTQCFVNADRMYSSKKKVIAQYNPYDWANAGTNPLTKIGSFWWGKGTENVVNGNYRAIEHGTAEYLNCSFVTGATVGSPKGFSWEVTLDNKSGYFEMYIGGRDTAPKSAELAAGLELNIEFYLDGVLQETIVKKRKACEPIRFDFSNAQTGKVRLYVTDGASTYAAFLVQATWWETDVSHGPIFKAGKVPCLLMDSWGIYKDAEVEKELERLLSVDVVNVSQGGETSLWGATNFDSLVLPEDPDYVITDLQINDINSSVSESDYISNMETIKSKAVNNWIVPVFLMQAHATATGNYCKYTFPFITAQISP